GLVQFFSTDTHTVFWTVRTAGQVFGPFVNRNHFAFYINICILISTGLLLSRFAGRTEKGSSARTIPARRPARSGTTLLLWFARQGAGLDAETIGILFALGLMVSSVLISTSRGGFVALAGGAILGLALRLRRRGSPAGERLVLSVPVVVL